MPDRIGQQLGNYRLLRQLGRGGFAEVYLGEHVYLKTLAAIKVLHVALAKDDMESFLMEARTIAHLVHPHIVRVLEFGVEDTTPYLVMDYAPNGTLRQRHPRGTMLAPAVIVPYIKQVAEALQYAHERKLIHRDIKPENLLLGRSFEVLLSDFGIALVAQSSRHTGSLDVVGTVAYMAPEQIQGQPRPASDQYALGVVVYEWLSGTALFQGSFTELCSQHLFAPPPPLREKVPTISPILEMVVMTALAKDSKDRFATVTAFANALEQASRSEFSFPTSMASPAPAQPAAPTPPAVLPPEHVSQADQWMFSAPTQVTPPVPLTPPMPEHISQADQWMLSAPTQVTPPFPVPPGSLERADQTGGTFATQPQQQSGPLGDQAAREETLTQAPTPDRAAGEGTLTFPPAPIIPPPQVAPQQIAQASPGGTSHAARSQPISLSGPTEVGSQTQETLPFGANRAPLPAPAVPPPWPGAVPLPAAPAFISPPPMPGGPNVGVAPISPPSTPRRRRGRVVALIAVVVLLLLGAASAGALFLFQQPGKQQTTIVATATLKPTGIATSGPTINPTHQPTANPTVLPTTQPTQPTGPTATPRPPTPTPPPAGPPCCAPQQISPGNRASLNYNPRNVTASWQSVPGATYYVVYVYWYQQGNTSCSGGTEQGSYQTSGTSLTFSYDEGTEPGCWEVRAFNSSGPGPYSYLWEFQFTF